MTSQKDRARRFLDLHVPGAPLLMPNAWDAGSAKLLASLGFHALATTSSGHAATLGQLDGTVTREQALANAAAIVEAAGEIPVSADLENCFADDADGVAQTVRGARAAGLAGCSIEDYTGDPGNPIYPLDLAAARVEAAVAAAHDDTPQLVLTARCENYLHGLEDMGDTVTRLRAYGEAGADVLYAPGLRNPYDIGQLVSAFSQPVNVLAVAGGPDVGELAALHVARISVGGAFAFAALGAVVEAAEELRDRGTLGYLKGAGAGVRAARQAFS